VDHVVGDDHVERSIGERKRETVRPDDVEAPLARRSDSLGQDVDAEDVRGERREAGEKSSGPASHLEDPIAGADAGELREDARLVLEGDFGDGPLERRPEIALETDTFPRFGFEL
jgi:hypothetical protein